VILRERLKKKKAELTYKLRPKDSSARTAARVEWQCPLGPNAEKKEEVDISFAAQGDPKQVLSRSCTLEGEPGDVQFPFAAEALACTSSMTRVKVGGYKIEEWQLGDRARLIEVSRNGQNTPEATKAFAKTVARLTDPRAGAKPIDRSKSEAGSECAVKPRKA
jgi:hypothetical protein